MSLPERIRYGAAELRRFYNRNLFMALGISIALHLAVIGLYLSNTGEVIAGSDNHVPEIGPTIILHPIDQPETGLHVQPPKPDGGSQAPSTPRAPIVDPPSFRSDGLAGNPTPTDDSLINPKKGEFANTDKIATSDPNGERGGSDPNGRKDDNTNPPQQGGGGGGTLPAVTPKEDIPNEFPDPDVILPEVDLADISARAEYPRMARENGIEGRVTVKVLIGEDGRPLRVSIESGAAAVLDTAAIRAVRETTFRPATLNGTPVKAWIFVPVNFDLD